MNPFIQLNPNDNVLVALRAVAKGTSVAVDGGELVLSSDIPLAHKVCVRAITKGEDVLKYGMVIGRASRDIAPGDHVHVHNLESKYTPAIYREEEAK